MLHLIKTVGFDQVPIPTAAFFDRSLLRGIIQINEPEPQGRGLGPFDIVRQGPGVIGVQLNAVVDGPAARQQVFVKVIDPVVIRDFAFPV